MSRQRRSFAGSEKIAILREHLIERAAIDGGALLKSSGTRRTSIGGGAVLILDSGVEARAFHCARHSQVRHFPIHAVAQLK